MKEELLKNLNESLKEFSEPNWDFQQLRECPTSDIVLKTSCYIAFFTVIEEETSVAEVCKVAEREIIEARDKIGREWPRDLNLVMLVKEVTEYGVIRRLIDDHHYCRKFVLNLNGTDIKNILYDLPFFPPGGGRLEIDPVLVEKSVQKVLEGFDLNLIASLAGRSPGVDKITEYIIAGKYQLIGETSTGGIAKKPKFARPSTRKLEALEIQDFRGIRYLRPEDMPLNGDIVLIYGPNGVGKTSIAQAVEWAITGRVGRLKRESSKSSGPDPIVNVFSDKREVRVTCYFGEGNPVCRIKRGQSIERLIGDRKEREDRSVIDYVVGSKAPSREATLRIEQLRDLVCGSHILSQHNIRQFLEESLPTSRFDTLTNMIGAEAFVRFRIKVASVANTLRSHASTKAEQTKSLSRELKEASTKLSLRKMDIDNLKESLTIEISPENLVTEIAAGIQSAECTYDETLFDKAIADPTTIHLEYIAIHVDTTIRNKKNDNNDLVVQIMSLEKDLPGFIDARSRCEDLKSEIVSAKNKFKEFHISLRKLKNDHQQIQIQIQDILAILSKATENHENLNWLKENRPAYVKYKSTIQSLESSLKGLREKKQKSEITLEQIQGTLNAKQARIEEIENIITYRKVKQQSLSSQLQRLPQILAMQNEVEQLAKKEAQLHSDIDERTQQELVARNEMDAARLQLAEQQHAYDTEAKRHEALSSFLVTISEMVRSAECPLCGRDFASIDEAHNTIQTHLSALPQQLKDLAHRLDGANKNSESQQKLTSSIRDKIRALKSEEEKVHLDKTVAEKIVKEFVNECVDLGITVDINGISSWQSKIKKEMETCNILPLESEIRNLKDEIASIMSNIIELKNTISGCQQRFAQDENECVRLKKMLWEINAEIIERNFEAESLPEMDNLDAKLSMLLNMVKEYNELITKNEAKNKAIESSIQVQRKDLLETNEDVANKKTQLRQYETICSRFIAACNIIGIDLENPIDGIRTARQKASKLDQLLSALQSKNQILQQIASLNKIRLEIDNLMKEMNEKKQLVDQNTREDSRLRKWLSLFDRLENDIVKRQIDIVGSHLESLEPTTQQLYKRLNPHPVFGEIKIRVDEKTRELNFEAESSLDLPKLEKMAISPKDFFSDAQMNLLAITVFLAGALRQRWSGLKTILIDDPIQQMDDMNAYAFIDVIRGLSGSRQFIIFTCSLDFYHLGLERMLCLNSLRPGRFLAFRLEGISPASLKAHRDA